MKKAVLVILTLVIVVVGFTTLRPKKEEVRPVKVTKVTYKPIEPKDLQKIGKICNFGGVYKLPSEEEQQKYREVTLYYIGQMTEDARIHKKISDEEARKIVEHYEECLGCTTEQVNSDAQSGLWAAPND